MFGFVLVATLLGLCINLITVNLDPQADLVGWDAVGHEESSRTASEIR
jgi:hypothetical protein